MKVSDGISGGLLVVVGSAVLLHVRSFPSPPPPAYGPATFPTLIGLIIVVCGVVLIVRAVIARQRVVSASIGEWVRSPRHIGNLTIAILGVLGFVFLADRIGFLAFTTFFLASAYIWLGVRWYRAIPLSFLGAYLVQLLFSDLLRISLPAASALFLRTTP